MFGLVDYASSEEEEETLPTQPSEEKSEETEEVLKKPSPSGEQAQTVTSLPPSIPVPTTEESRFEEFQIKTPKSMSDFHAFVREYALNQFGTNFSSMTKSSPAPAQENNEEQKFVDNSSSARSSGRRSKWDMTSN